VLGSGGMSHRFWPLGRLAEHLGYDPTGVVSDDARAADARILEWWRAGDHAAVIDFYDQYAGLAPEGRFGHYLVAVGAFGGARCRIPGAQLSDYENSIGTGQVHVWFDAHSTEEERT
jgi:hypothetical protein